MDTAKLQSLGITHIVNATAEENNFFEDQFVYHRIPLYDKTSERAALFFDEFIDFVSSALAGHGKVMIHCKEGISRSVTLVLAYRMIREHITLRKAFEDIKVVRPHVEPNPGFLQELRELEFAIWGQVITNEQLTAMDLGGLDTDNAVDLLKRHIATFIAGGVDRVGQKAMH